MAGVLFVGCLDPLPTLQRKAAPGVGAACHFYDEAPGLGGKVGWGIQGALMSSI